MFPRENWQKWQDLLQLPDWNARSEFWLIGIDFDEVILVYYLQIFEFMKRVFGLELNPRLFDQYRLSSMLNSEQCAHILSVLRDPSRTEFDNLRKVGKSFHDLDSDDWDFSDRAEKIDRAHSHPTSSNTTLALMKYVLAAYHESPEFQSIQPELEAIAALRAMAPFFNLVIITARQRELMMNTRSILDTWLPDLAIPILYGNTMSLNNLAQVPKITYVSELGARVLIDDSLSHILDCSRLTQDPDSHYLAGILLHKLWNQSPAANTHSILRVENWEQVLQRLGQLAIEHEYFNETDVQTMISMYQAILSMLVTDGGSSYLAYFSAE